MSELEHKETMQALTLPTMALRGITVFPSMLLHFDVGRQTSIKALDQAVELGSYIFLVPQKDLSVDDPELSDLYSIGTIAAVRQVLRLPGDSIRVMVEGIARARTIECWQDKPFFVMQVEQIQPGEKTANTVRAEAVIRITYDLIQRYCELSPKTSSDVLLTVVDSNNPGYMADYMAQNLSIRGEDKQTILEELRPVRRLEKMNRILRREIQVLEMEKELETKVKDQVSQNQKDYYLREQLKVIQSELGETGDGMDEITEYEQKINAAKLPEEVDAKLRKELTRLSKQPYSSAEASVLRNYLDVCLELPWTVRTKERLNVEAARKVLDAVKQLAPDLRGQIICLVGPPGVGKTSIASSLAKAMNRKMARVSLGGIHDEAEIRGHRKTYVGAMPGRIIAAIQKAGSSNPLLLLDEIDKLGADSRSDPSAALLEVLDAAQNATFRDHFLELPFDLSDVVFITTANDLSTVSRPLLDRMEVIELSSYTDEEKLQIARRHLLPNEMKRHGLTGRSLRVTDGAIREIITGYTRESGVRLLQRELAAVCRKAAMELVTTDAKRVTVNGDNLEHFLGIRRYHPEKLDHTPQVGLVNGLAWTSVGGTLLEVEVNVVPGSGKVEPTGNLGDVMKESCHSAISYIRSRTSQLNIDPDFYKTKDIHIHFPEGAVPKDGPSAGVTITTAIVSALTNTPVKADVAMTGEVTLRGRVLAIGGLKEKTMAAYRNGIQTVIIPAENQKDLEEIDQTVRQALHFVPVEQVDEVLAEALAYPVTTTDASSDVPALPLEDSPAQPAAVGLQQ